MNIDHNQPAIAGKFYQLYRVAFGWFKLFPKKERYSLGEKTENAILDALTEIYYLNQLPNPLKENRLLILSAKNDLIKTFFRLALDLRVLEFGRYEQAQTLLQETGKMIGGWIKFVRNSH